MQEELKKKPQQIMCDNSLKKSLVSFTFTFAIRLVLCNLMNGCMEVDKFKTSSAI